MNEWYHWYQPGSKEYLPLLVSGIPRFCPSILRSPKQLSDHDDPIHHQCVVLVIINNSTTGQPLLWQLCRSRHHNHQYLHHHHHHPHHHHHTDLSDSRLLSGLGNLPLLPSPSLPSKIGHPLSSHLQRLEDAINVSRGVVFCSLPVAYI